MSLLDRLYRILYAPDDGGGTGTAVEDPPADSPAPEDDSPDAPESSADDSTPETDPTEPAGDTDDEPESEGWLRIAKKEHREKLKALNLDSADAMIADYLATRDRLDGAIPKLPEDPTDEQLAEYRQAVGVPESAEAYEFEPLDTFTITIPDENGRDSLDVEYDITDTLGGEFDTWFAQRAFERNIPADVAKELHQDYQRYAVEQIQASAKERRERTKEVVAGLIKEHGEEAFYRKLREGRQAARSFMSNDLDRILGAAGITSSPEWFDAMVRLSDMFSGSRLPPGAPGGGEPPRQKDPNDRATWDDVTVPKR